FERRAVLHTQGSTDHDGPLENALQHGPSAQQSRGPATRTRNPSACELRTNIVGGTKTPGWSHAVLKAPKSPPARPAGLEPSSPGVWRDGARRNHAEVAGESAV